MSVSERRACRVLAIELDDGLPFPFLQPEVARNPTVVFVQRAVAFTPAVKLARRNRQPSQEAFDADLGFLRPASNEIDDLVANVGRDPLASQLSPRLFLAPRARPSARRALRPWSGSFAAAARCDLALAATCGTCSRRRRRRFQITPFASDSKPSAEP